MTDMKQNFARLHATTVRQKHTYLYSKHFLTGVKNHIAIAKLWIDKHILLPGKTESDLGPVYMEWGTPV